MIKLHIVVHESFESPGSLIRWASERRHNISFSRVYLNEKLPITIDEIDGLIIMGGPQSPNTTKEECSHFDAIAEMELIKKCIDQQKLVVGICLGAQMIGHTLGAPAERSPEPEIGYFPILKTDKGRSHPGLSHFPDKALVGHWHGDMAGLTPQAEVLAYSEGCPRQLIAYADLVYGLQCHMEFDPNCIEGLIENSVEELKLLNKRKYVSTSESLRRKKDFTEMNQLLHIFLDHLIEVYRIKKQKMTTF